MNKNMLVLTFILLIVSIVPSFGQLREHPDESLKGVKGIRVIVDYKGPVEDSYGLSRKQLQNAVELQLKVDGIKILTGEEWSHEPGKPYLNIIIVGTQVGSGKSPTFFYSFATDLIQEVSLGRKPSLKTEGSTWNQDYAFVVAKDDLREVTMKIGDVAREFAQSVHEANE
jgi:hypothetical protein